MATRRDVYDGHPHRQAKSILEAMWLLGAIAIIVLFVRLFTSIKCFRKLGLADSLMIGATACMIISNVFSTIYIREGAFMAYLPDSDLSTQQADTMMRNSAMATLFSVASLALSRISFAWWLLRLATERYMRMTLYACIAIGTIVDVGLLFFLIGKCHPEDGEQLPTCMSSSLVYNLAYVDGSINVLIDLTLSLLPALLVARLRLPIRLRISIAVVLGFSVFAAAACLAKTVELRQMADNTTGSKGVWRWIFWHTLEMSVIIVTASVPAIRPLFVFGQNSRRSSDENRLRDTDMAEAQKGSCITSWTGYNECPFTLVGETSDDMRFGHSITIQGGLRDEHKMHPGWYKKSQKSPDVSRVDIGPFQPVSMVDGKILSL